MASRISKKFNDLMLRKIQDNEDLTTKNFDNLPAIVPDEQFLQHAGLFYWGSRELKNSGHATIFSNPKSCSPLLSQLLVTPRLIVNIVPLPPQKFAQRYGVTSAQLHELIAHGFVIPSIYHYYNNGWHDYAKHRHLWPILEHPATRINGKWISAYLDRYFRFSRVREKTQALFQDTLPSGIDEVGLLKAIGQPEGSMEGLFAKCGQQLAYLETLGIKMNPRLDKINQKIKRLWAEAGRQVEAANLLKATKDIVLSDVTAAFGGRYHMTETEYDTIHRYATQVVSLSELTKGQTFLADVEQKTHFRELAEFLLGEVDRLRGIPLQEEADRKAQRGEGVLEPDEFKSYLHVLHKSVVTEGRLGQFADEIRIHLIGKKSNTNISNYREAISEIELSLRPFPLVGAGLRRISNVTSALSIFNEHNPAPSGEGIAMWISFGIATGFLRGWAEKADNTEYVDLSKWGRERRLCKSWATIRADIAKQVEAQ